MQARISKTYHEYNVEIHSVVFQGGVIQTICVAPVALQYITFLHKDKSAYGTPISIDQIQTLRPITTQARAGV